MKRQNSTMLSSSSYRENVNAPSADSNLHAKSIGCMSGVIQLVCKYHNRRKFLITFGKKPEKNIVVSSSFSNTKRPIGSSPSAKSRERRDTRTDAVPRTPDDKQPRPRISCEVPGRSPTIPPEIRRSKSVNSPENFRSTAATPPSPSLVARLMGLGGETSTTVPPSESASEKRRKLLGALEKCDQDLKSLKKIIDAVRSTEVAHRKPDPTAKSNDVGSDQEQPSPVSVLDELTRSPTLTRCVKRQPNERVLQQQQVIKTKKSGEVDGDNHSPVISLSERIKLNIMEPLPPSARRSSSPISSSPLSPDHYYDDHLIQGYHDKALFDDDSRLKAMISRGMRESVEQVCRDVQWGERREIGRIGLALHDHICRELIEETVKELGILCNSLTLVVPPFEACKRRLCF